MDPETRQRLQMVACQLGARDIDDPAVLAAFESVPRHRFVPQASLPDAYADHPLPIGQGQTISQPYIVAFMLQALRLRPGQDVLEVGAGCGYVTALLVHLGVRVRALEVERTLAHSAVRRLEELGYGGVDLRCGDGSQGWPGAVCFDAIIVSAAAVQVPPILLRQLRPGGRLIMPVGEMRQELVLFEAAPQEVRRHTLLPVRFVPLRRGC